MTKTTTSIRIDLDLFIKLKTKKINLSNLINKFLSDYLIETEGEFELEELKKEKDKISEEINFLKNKEMKYLVSINKKEEEIKKELKDIEEKNLQRTQSMKELNPMRYI